MSRLTAPFKVYFKLSLQFKTLFMSSVATVFTLLFSVFNGVLGFMRSSE